MYSPHQPVSALGNGIMDDSGTINPAALESSGLLPHSSPTLESASNFRGIKRSRTPDTYDDIRVLDGEDEDGKPRKRGRPPKGKGDSPSAAPTPASSQTPQLKPQPLAHASPVQASPPKPAAGGKVKALPTVRDHTTDQLNPEGDEYIPREWDDQGEKKVSETGHLTEGRQYRCRVFLVPNRGEKLFMLATECARVLNYRDSYLLFNKNRSLFKIIANQTEKDELIRNDILPYSYRSRQIAIVTARSMYRQFGSRIIVNGRRVRDDYWESKARKQGFTEDDAAGEKRPGASKQRDEAAQQASSTNATAMNTLAHGEIRYINGPGLGTDGLLPGGAPGAGGLLAASAAQLPLINLAPMDDSRLRDYGNVPRPRQDISGTTAFQDRSQPSAPGEIVGHAAQSAEFNKTLSAQRLKRSQYYEEQWKREHAPIPSSIQQQGLPETDDVAAVAPAYSSPLHRANANIPGMGQPQMMPGQPPHPSQMQGQPYPPQPPQGQPHMGAQLQQQQPSPHLQQQQAQHQQQMQQQQQQQQQQQHKQSLGQSPLARNMQQPPHGHGMGMAGGHGQNPNMAFAPNQMWPPHQQPGQQPQQSPHSPHNMQPFGQHPGQQGSPVPPSPHHLPQHLPPSSANAAAMQHLYGMGGMSDGMGGNMVGMGMGGMGNPAGFRNMAAAAAARGMYAGSPPNAQQQQQFLQQQIAGGVSGPQAAAMQSWAVQQSAGPGGAQQQQGGWHGF